MAKRKRKYFIDIQEAEAILTAFGFDYEIKNEFTIRIKPELTDMFFDWFHTQGTLMSGGNGKPQKKLGTFGDVEELSEYISKYVASRFVKDNKKEIKKQRTFKKVNKKVKMCPYCSKRPEWVSNKEVYGKEYGRSYMIWLCRDCDAYVGCHNNSRKPLGRLADAKTRNARKLTKNLFIEKCLNGNWKCEKDLKVSAYYWLSNELGITKEQCHFGDFDIEMCRKAYRVLLNISSFNK